MVIDHVSLAVRDLPVAARFYERALAPLGFTLLYRQQDFVAFGRPGNDDFGLHQANAYTGGAHVAFAATAREKVDQFWVVALAAGAKPKAPPALHPEYHPGYYAAFVYDIEGNNIEAVLHQS